MEYSETGRGTPEGEAQVRILNILYDSVVDGEGLRTVLFFSGCPHHCPGCHNPHSWSPQGGKVMKVWEVVEQALLNPINEVTLSGGDPFYQAETVRHVAKILKTNGKNLWAYTGYTLEFIQDRGSIAMKELLSYCDVLVDGGFELELRDPTLRFRGSSNQRIHRLGTW
ncbi:anaerobic ribonucleoside-triphosphate reductase activating protein [Paenibacillus larvae]|nr:anaerobic ribonucleoside-triphosphate reductase activating protein [Paenibacillus larvae]MDT2238677.1 anaerobic ribonucleoside-triphosphate reductase activating protein [Paenibacillus larvae]